MHSWFLFGSAGRHTSPFSFFSDLSHGSFTWAVQFCLSENLPACVHYGSPQGRRQQLKVWRPCCPSVCVATRRDPEIRKQAKAVLRAHGLISLIAFSLSDYLSIRLEPGSKRRFPAQPDVSATYMVQRAFFWRYPSLSETRLITLPFFLLQKFFENFRTSGLLMN